MSLIKEILRVCYGVTVAVVLSDAANAQCASPPNILTNGQATDATKVMGNFSHLTTCLNSGQLMVPPVPSLSVTGPGGGTVTIDNPTSSTPYNLGLPPNTGTNGQFLSTNGSGQTSWATVPTAAPLPLVDGVPIGRPAASAMTWLNQGGATYTEHTNGPITVFVPAGSGDQLRGLGTAPPGPAPYTLTAKIDAVTWATNYVGAGLFIQDSAGKLVTFNQLGSGGNAGGLQVTYWNSVTSWNSGPFFTSINGYRTYWLRIRNDGTNWTFYWSLNGADWVSIYSSPLTTFLGSTISKLGVFGNATTSSVPTSAISIWSYELASGSGTNSSWQ